jgi:hypothetical protein
MTKDCKRCQGKTKIPHKHDTQQIALARCPPTPYAQESDIRYGLLGSFSTNPVQAREAQKNKQQYPPMEPAAEAGEDIDNIL